MELKVFQGYSMLTLHMLPNQTGILGGETILLVHDVHLCGPIYMWNNGTKGVTCVDTSNTM